MKKIGDFVLKFIGSIFVFISLVLSLSAHARSGSGTGGGMDSGGGSGLALIFRNEGYRAAKIISTLPNFPLSQIQFEEIVRTTRVEVSDEQLVDPHGVEVPALTNPRAKLIRLNAAKIIDLLLAPKMSLTFVVHQYLVMAGINDYGNIISNRLLASKFRILTNVTCESKKGDRQDVMILNYKETDSDGDKKSDAQSAFSYFLMGDNLEIAWQSDVPLIAKKETGVLLTVNSVGVALEKLFLPRNFLAHDKSELQLDAYYVRANAEEKTKVSNQFVCKHVTEENVQTGSLSQSETRSPAADPDMKEIGEIVKKETIRMLTESFPKQIRYVATVIDSIPGFPLTGDQFNELAQSTRIEFTDDNLFEPGGMKVDALNYPKLKLIRFNFMRTFSAMMAPRQGLQLLVHEYLGIAGIDDHDYSVSEKILTLRGETVTQWVCETEVLEKKDKVTLSYREVDYNGDKDRDETIFLGTDSEGKELQVPLYVKDLAIEPTVAVNGVQALWSSPDSTRIYQAYLPQKLIENSTKVKLPFFEVSTTAKDSFKKPAGTLSCQFGIR